MAREHRKIKGVMLLLAANGCFCLSGILVKCGLDIGPLRLAFFRFVVGAGLVAAVTRSGRFKLQFNDKRLLFVRGLCGGTAIYIAFLAISKLGLGKGMLLICCYPIFACIFSAIFLKERFGVLSMAAIFVALTGIYFVSREGSESFSVLKVFGKYEIITLIGAVISGVAVTTVRKLHDTDNSWSIYFSQCLGGMALFGVPALAMGWNISWEGWLIMLGIGVGATGGAVIDDGGISLCAGANRIAVRDAGPGFGVCGGCGYIRRGGQCCGCFRGGSGYRVVLYGAGRQRTGAGFVGSEVNFGKIFW
jgi:drug/metabolite transporter (DMT)-like permease